MAWWQDAVFYQIYPRSFMDGNGDGVGDLAGILNRLDYLVDLGVDALWISPIYPSPMADFGYDVADYTDIHPLFGDMATFDRLLEAAHAREMKIVLDYVPNHSSDEHPWFIEARASRESAKRDWYIWRDALPDGSPPNNWTAFFGGSAWEWDATTQQYYLHLFHKKQPDLNWRNPEVVAAMHDVLRFWLDRGVDGFRMDVVTFLIKHAEMPDNPADQQIYNINQPEIHSYLRDFRRLFDSYPGERVTIGETWFFDPSELARYYGETLDELHLPFNFITLKTDWDATAFKTAIQGYYHALPVGATPNFVLGNHDVPRLATRYGLANHRAAGLLLLTLRGVPTLYQGDEIGMTDGHIPVEAIQDPQGQHDPSRNRDGARTPLQWDSTPNAGFAPADVTTWLPVAENYPQVNIASQANDPHSTLTFYKRLLHIRRGSAVLRHAGEKNSFRFVEGDFSADVLAYLREGEGERLLVVINFGADHHMLNFSTLAGQGTLLLSTHFSPERTLDLKGVALKPHEGLLIQVG